MKLFITRFAHYYSSKNRFLIPILAGLFYCLGVPPFNSLLHPAFTFFPFFSFIICIPLIFIASQSSPKRAALHLYLFGIFASAGQFYWIAFVVPEGLWHLILFGVFLITLYQGLFFLAAGLGFRFALRKFPRAYPFIIPAIWVCIEYIKGLGEISFPWNHIGYSLTSILPLSQLASVTGVFGLSFFIVLSNALIWRYCTSLYCTGKKTIGLPLFILFCCGLATWGFFRIKTKSTHTKANVSTSVLQGNIDQNHWGNNSLDTSFQKFDTLIQRAAIDKPDLVILPESALLCYLLRQRALREQVELWSSTYHIPLMLGALDWDVAPKGSPEHYWVHNTALYLDPLTIEFKKYFKIKLVPFSEALPFTGFFPMLSRVNLGQADFKPGTEATIFTIGKNIKAAPFICYEIVYPDFVRKRVKLGANLLVNMTNDGWFGKSSGPFQHATMARMRCIENGVSLARSANSGISMFVDQFGNVHGITKLYTQTELTRKISTDVIPTLYTKFGDWPVFLASFILMISCVTLLFRKGASRLTKNPPNTPQL